VRRVMGFKRNMGFDKELDEELGEEQLDKECEP
jgi:hypothetical protein